MSSQVPSSGNNSKNNIPSSSHRLPTVSASDALRRLRDPGARTITTGIPRLDNVLVGTALATYGRGGVARGQLTEIFGPPGSGKTAFGLKLASAALENATKVIWIDCVYSVPKPRLESLFRGGSSKDNFHRYTTPTLAHLLALVHHQKTGFPPDHTSLIVIDDVSALFPLPAPRQASKPPSTPSRPVAPILQTTLLSALSRIASTYNIAVVLTTQVTTRIRQASAAVLVPAIGSRDWEDAMSSRLVLFRDFAPQTFDRDYFEKLHHDATLLDRLRYIGIVKANGLVTVETDLFKDLIPLSIMLSGDMIPITFPVTSSAPAMVRSPAPNRKRRIDEIPDSEEEWEAELEGLDDYDWQQDNDTDEQPQILTVRDSRPQDKKVKTDNENSE